MVGTFVIKPNFWTIKNDQTLFRTRAYKIIKKKINSQYKHNNFCSAWILRDKENLEIILKIK